MNYKIEIIKFSIVFTFFAVIFSVFFTGIIVLFSVEEKKIKEESKQRITECYEKTKELNYCLDLFLK